MTKHMAKKDTRVDTNARTHAIVVIPTDLDDSITRSAFAPGIRIAVRRRKNQGAPVVAPALWLLRPCGRTEWFLILPMPESSLDKMCRLMIVFILEHFR